MLGGRSLGSDARCDMRDMRHPHPRSGIDPLRYLILNEQSVPNSPPSQSSTFGRSPVMPKRSMTPTQCASHFLLSPRNNEVRSPSGSVQSEPHRGRSSLSQSHPHRPNHHQLDTGSLLKRLAAEQTRRKAAELGVDEFRSENHELRRRLVQQRLFLESNLDLPSLPGEFAAMQERLAGEELRREHAQVRVTVFEGWAENARHSELSALRKVSEMEAAAEFHATMPSVKEWPRIKSSRDSSRESTRASGVVDPFAGLGIPSSGSQLRLQVKASEELLVDAESRLVTANDQASLWGQKCADAQAALSMKTAMVGTMQEKFLAEQSKSQRQTFFFNQELEELKRSLHRSESVHEDRADALRSEYSFSMKDALAREQLLHVEKVHVDSLKSECWALTNQLKTVFDDRRLEDETVPEVEPYAIARRLVDTENRLTQSSQQLSDVKQEFLNMECARDTLRIQVGQSEMRSEEHVATQQRITEVNFKMDRVCKGLEQELADNEKKLLETELQLAESSQQVEHDAAMQQVLSQVNSKTEVFQDTLSQRLAERQSELARSENRLADTTRCLTDVNRKLTQVEASSATFEQEAAMARRQLQASPSEDQASKESQALVRKAEADCSVMKRKLMERQSLLADAAGQYATTKMQLNEVHRERASLLQELEQSRTELQDHIFQQPSIQNLQQRLDLAERRLREETQAAGHPPFRSSVSAPVHSPRQQQLQEASNTVLQINDAQTGDAFRANERVKELQRDKRELERRLSTAEARLYAPQLDRPRSPPMRGTIEAQSDAQLARC